MKKVSLLVIMTCLSGALWAGDVAVFKNLGFSPDSRYFQFAQYGIDSSAQNPYVEVFTLDVPRNEYYLKGNSRSLFNVAPTLGDDGQKALFAQTEKLLPLRKSLKLDYLEEGRPIYFRVTGENTTQDFDNFQVLDYKTGKEYDVQMNKTVTPASGTSPATSVFFIQLDIKDKSGKVLGSYKVGHPSLVRKGVQNYTVNQMILSPNERALIFVVEKEESDGQGGINLRSMVESITLNSSN